MRRNECMNFQNFIRKNASTILSIIGGIGVVGTAILTAKATPKALEVIRADSRINHDGDPDAYTVAEAIESSWSYFITPAMSGVATLFCIFGAGVLNKKQVNSVLAASGIINGMYKDYRQKNIELHGLDTDKEIMASIAADEADTEVRVCAYDAFGTSCLEFGDENYEKELFYEPISKRYFWSTIPMVLEAQYTVNRNLVLGGEISLNDYLEFLRIDGVEGGDTLLWAPCDEYVWIDFMNQITADARGNCIHVLNVLNEPETLEYWNKYLN